MAGEAVRPSRVSLERPFLFLLTVKRPCESLWVFISFLFLFIHLLIKLFSRLTAGDPYPNKTSFVAIIYEIVFLFYCGVF